VLYIKIIHCVIDDIAKDIIIRYDL